MQVILMDNKIQSEKRKCANIHTQKQAEPVSPQAWKVPAHICTSAQSPQLFLNFSSSSSIHRN